MTSAHTSALTAWIGWLLVGCSLATADDDSTRKLAQLPGGTTQPLGQLESAPYELGDGPECEKGLIVVPEDRQTEDSRNIGIHFYRFKARQPSRKAPVFMMPGGPGGFFNDNWVNGLKSEPKGGSNAQAWLYSQDRDVVLVNQRGASQPDRRYQFFGFFTPPASLDEPYSADGFAKAFQTSYKRAVDHWSQQGLHMAGYDIMNMVEDIDDLRKALGYEKIMLRGTSFGSQWSFAYMRAYPEHVDRALLSGTEPIDFGYDSPQGIWNVFQRLEERLTAASKTDDRWPLPDVPLRQAIQQIVTRLEQSPVEVEVKHPTRDLTRSITLGVDDFQRQLRSGIGGRRESAASLQNFPKFIYEILQEDYRYLAFQAVGQRSRPSGANLQGLLIDNSLGISAARDAKLTAETPRKWLGELNLIYKATRDVTPTPVVTDSFRQLETAIPVLLIHGDLDLSTPFENAEAALPTLKNGHLIKIVGGTHGAFDQIDRQDPKFRDLIKRFLDADFDADGLTVESLDFPAELSLTPLDFTPLSEPALFDQISKDD